MQTAFHTVAGKIQDHVEFWKKELQSPPFIIDIVKNGYKLPFVSTPPPFYAKNNKSSLENQTFVTESITNLLQNKCIIETKTAPYCVNPLTVATKSKLRLVIDLRHVNKYVQKNNFKYDNLKVISEIFNTGDYFITFDLKSGYHHVPINKEFQKFLGFSWILNGQLRFFKFLVLPFGLSSACYIFTKLMRQLVKRRRAEGIKCAMYLDDGIGGSSTAYNTASICEKMLRDVSAAGLTINHEKSNLLPTRQGSWLGFIIDTEKMMFFIPSEKIKALLTKIKSTLRFEYSTARNIAKIAGYIVSMSIAIGPLTRLFTKQMHVFIESRFSWDGLRIIPFEVKTELLFWQNNLKQANGVQINFSPHVNKIVYSDASGKGYGGYIVQKFGETIARGDFEDIEIPTSSTFRELLAVKYILQAFNRNLNGQCVQWYSDNENVSRIISGGSSKNHLQAIAIDIYNVCVINNIILLPAWVPREFNKIADRISKEVDTDNWGIDDETFAYIQANFGKFEVDRFADNKNNKVDHFNSKYHCPGSSAVNCFTCNWKPTFNWLCPPIYLIGKTLRYLELCKGKGVLLVPIWKSAYYWPMLTKDGNNFNPFIKNFLLLDPFFLNYAKLSNSVFDGFAKFYSIALLLDFS